jgi:hypothetical protein
MFGFVLSMQQENFKIKCEYHWKPGFRIFNTFNFEKELLTSYQEFAMEPQDSRAAPS